MQVLYSAHDRELNSRFHHVFSSCNLIGSTRLTKRWNRTRVYPRVAVRRVASRQVAYAFARSQIHNATRRDATRGSASYCELGFSVRTDGRTVVLGRVRSSKKRLASSRPTTRGTCHRPVAIAVYIVPYDRPSGPRVHFNITTGSNLLWVIQ